MSLNMMESLTHPNIFTDWFDNMEDYLDWYGMSDIERRFAKMK